MSGDSTPWTHRAEKVGVRLCLSEKRLVLCHGVLVEHLLGVCSVHQLEMSRSYEKTHPPVALGCLE